MSANKDFKSIRFLKYIDPINDKTYKISNTSIDHIEKYIFEELVEGDRLIFERLVYNDDCFKNISFNNIKLEFNFCDFRQILRLNLNNTELKISSNLQEDCKEIGLNIKGIAKSVCLTNLNLDEFEISSSNISDLTVTRNNIDTFSISNKTSIGKFSISNEKKDYKINKLFFDLTKIDELLISYLDTLSNIYINFCDIKTFKFEEVCISDQIKFERYNVDDLKVLKSKITNFIINFYETGYKRELNSFSLNNIEFADDSKISQLLIKQKGNRCNINSILISAVEKIDISNLIVNKITVKNQVINESIFSNVKFGSLELNGFASRNKFNFSNCTVIDKNGLLILNNSVLDNVAFNPSFLHQFKEIRFTNSSLINLQANNLTEIPTRTIRPFKRDIETNYLTLYRELKILAQNYGDNYLFHKLKALEYNERIWNWTFHPFKSKDYSVKDYFILLTNRISNNHTTNPFLAFGWILGLIILYVYSINCLTNSDFGNFLISNHTDYFIVPFKLFISNKDEIIGIADKFPNYLFYIDIGYHIILSYLIYQMIAAFRKFNR
ncbi:hypothetical protein [Cyclobacterium plantarum]|uniref:Pentapeptide repeat-containing protein n=1 Tax=Cyclobacterium plantarum TaxID=2716263 RepID=A0ABX0H842_9BACT|nr:hypothetical protein [Cyclobacterium plantarum]NHE57943.1 hypothetical protein [Cyclobacterium plantarum]